MKIPLLPMECVVLTTQGRIVEVSGSSLVVFCVIMWIVSKAIEVNKRVEGSERRSTNEVESEASPETRRRDTTWRKRTLSSKMIVDIGIIQMMLNLLHR